MRGFTVVWHKSAEDHLADLWITSLAPNTVTRAANSLENELRAHPESLGSAYHKSTRIAYVYPLEILFRVNADDRIVEVLGVRLNTSAG
jgi:hypothetical protein